MSDLFEIFSIKISDTVSYTESFLTQFLEFSTDFRSVGEPEKSSGRIKIRLDIQDVWSISYVPLVWNKSMVHELWIKILTQVDKNLIRMCIDSMQLYAANMTLEQIDLAISIISDV